MTVDINEPKDEARGKITPLSLAVSRGLSEIAEFLMSHRAQVTPETFFLSCKHPNLQIS